MAYKDKDKQREAVKTATRRYRAKKGDSGVLGQKQVSQNARGLPVIPSINKVKDMLKTKGYPRFKPRANDPDVQAIWDRRNAQGQAAAYSSDAKSEDYPQIQRPIAGPTTHQVEP